MSYFNMVSHDPPTIMVSIQTGSKKYEDGTKGEPAVADPWDVHWTHADERHKPQYQGNKGILRVNHL